MAKRFDVLAFVKEHGVVLASAKGPVPNLADAIAGETIRGTWWAHAKGHLIFELLGELDDQADVRCFRLVNDKLTFVHRRCWPALVVLAERLGERRLTAIRQEHTESGAHRNIETAYPAWVPAEVRRAAKKLTPSEAEAMLGPWVSARSKRP
ncbi:MAG: hypothetical protein J0L92_06340 [Deltaproteobacteria bacterium]|nr:hypothetical protein [Deltaproteobacteria bacterium]